MSLIITCRECGSDFVFSDGEIDFYESKGLNLPKKCPNCRNRSKKNVNDYVPKACSTCYFYSLRGYTSFKCTYNNELYNVDNDKPCSHWTRKMD